MMQEVMGIVGSDATANFRDQSDDVAPFEIMRHWMPGYRFERATVRTRYR